MEQRQQATAQGRHEGGFEDVVFEYHTIIGDGDALARIVVLHAVGQHTCATLVAEQVMLGGGE